MIFARFCGNGFVRIKFYICYEYNMYYLSWPRREHLQICWFHIERPRAAEEWSPLRMGVAPPSVAH